jgi:hypothetical protein
VSNEAEVYSLTALFLTSLLYLLSRIEERNIIFLTAFLFGLSLTNHMMLTSLLLPLLLLLLPLRKREAIIIFLFFLFGLSLYLFLPIRASLSPLINWGNPRDLTRFLWHITGKQYRVWMFNLSFPELLRNCQQSISSLARDTLFFFFPLSLLGIILSFRRNRKWSLFSLLLLGLSFLYAVNYTIPDIEPYYLPSFVSLLFFLSFTLKELKEKLRLVLGSVYLLLLPLPLIFNFSSNQKRDYYLAEDFARNAFVSAPESSLILTNWWDFYAPSLYLQHVRGERKDLCLIDKELLRRFWYYEYLKKVYPWLLENSKEELASFLSYLAQFESGRLKDTFGIQKSFIQYLRSLRDKNPERHFFLLFLPTFDYDLPGILEGRKIIPRGILFEITDDTIPRPFNYQNLTLRLPKKRLEERERLIINYYHLLAQKRLKYRRDEGLEDWLNKTRF